MSRWDKFLESLATKGGNIFLLVTLTVILLVAGVLLMFKFGPTPAPVSLVVGGFSSFMAALLMTLEGRNGGGGNGNGGVPPASTPVVPAH